MDSACGPFVDGYVSGSVDGPLLPEGLVKYRDEACLGPRPRRDSVREQIADYVLTMLGAPVVRLEIDAQQLTMAVDEAIMRYERGAPRWDYTWFYFDTVAGQNRYKLPCDVGLIRQVHFRPSTSCYDGSAAAEVAIDGSVIPFSGASFNNFGLAIRASGYPGRMAPAHVNVGEWALFQQYDTLFRRMSSREPNWEMAAENTIILYPMPGAARGVAVEHLQRKKDWEEAYNWMKDYALALAKIMLGRVRSKYDRYVSPSGGVTMDGPALLQEGNGEKATLEADLVLQSADHMLPVVG